MHQKVHDTMRSKNQTTKISKNETTYTTRKGRRYNEVQKPKSHNNQNTNKVQCPKRYKVRVLEPDGCRVINKLQKLWRKKDSICHPLVVGWRQSKSLFSRVEQKKRNDKVEQRHGTDRRTPICRAVVVAPQPQLEAVDHMVPLALVHDPSPANLISDVNGLSHQTQDHVFLKNIKIRERPRTTQQTEAKKGKDKQTGQQTEKQKNTQTNKRTNERTKVQHFISWLLTENKPFGDGPQDNLLQ